MWNSLLYDYINIAIVPFVVLQVIIAQNIHLSLVAPGITRIRNKIKYTQLFLLDINENKWRTNENFCLP